MGGNKSQRLNVVIADNVVVESSNERLLGIKVDRELKFDTQVKEICTKAGQKLSALSRQCKILPFIKRKMLVCAYFNSLFEYGKLVWMFHDRSMNTKINSLHCRALRIIYRDYTSSFQELLKLDGSCTVHHRNIKSLATEIYKCINGLSPDFMSNIFCGSNNAIENVSNFTRNHNDLYYSSNPRTEQYGISSLSYFGPIVWNMIPVEIKESKSLSIFKDKIKYWKISNCPCKLCKVFVPNLDYISITD